MSRRRRGMALMAVLAALVLIGLLGAALIQGGLDQRRRALLAERRAQADWLAESGLERAAARLRAEPDYSGETWEVPAIALGGRGAALVTIRVAPDDGAADRRRVSIRAEFPRKASALHVRREKQAVIPITSNGDVTGGPR